MSDDKMNVAIGLSVSTRGEELVDRLNRKVKALEASLRSITTQMQSAAKAASQPTGSKPAQATKANQGKADSDAKRSAADLYTFRSRLEAQRQRESARNESYLHKLRQSSFRQAERDNAKAMRDRISGEARVVAEQRKAAQDAARSARDELRSIREKVSFSTRIAAQRAREDSTAARDRRRADAQETRSIRERISFATRMAAQRQREEAETARSQDRATREAIRLDRYRMSLREREERRIHRESVARDNERDRLQGSVASNVRRAAHHGGDAIHRSARGIAGAGAVAGGVGALAARTGIGARMETDTAETNLKIFSEQTQAQIRDARRGWLDSEAIRNGLGVAGGLNAYGEVLKAGMKSPVENTKSIIGAVSALELDLRDTTKLAGLIDRNYGANSSPAKIKSALNAIAVAAREDPTQAPEIVEGMKRGFGVLSMGNMKPEELAALVSGGQSVGIQPGKAGTFIATLGKQLSSGANRFLDPKNRKELNFAASSMGFGNSREMARQFREDSTGTIMKVLESMKAMDPTKRTTVASALSGNQWNDEDLQIVNGLDGLKNTLAAVRDPSNAGFVDDAARKRQTSWLGQWNSTRAIFNRFWESFGAGFDEILTSINSYFLDLHGRFDFDQVTDIVRQGLEGVKEALGVKSWRELLSGMFGGNLAGVGQEVRSFARGFTAGVMEIIGGIKSVIVAFAGSKASTEEIARWTGRVVAFAAACVIAAPAVAVLGGLASGITALATAAIAAWKLMQAAGIVGGATAAAGAGAATAGAGAAAGAATGAGLLSSLMRIFGGAAINTVPAYSKEESDNLMLRFGRYAQERNKAREGAAPAWVNPPSVNDNLRKPSEDLRKAIEDNTLIQKQSYEANDNFAGLIRKAAFTSGEAGRITKATIQGQAGELRSAVSSGSTGVIGSGGPLSGSTPGSSLGNVGIGGRGIIGGGGTSPGAGPGNGSSMAGYGANPGAYKPLLDHIARSEGTASAPGGGYNTSLGYGKFLPGGKEQNLKGKTLDEIDALQSGMLAHPGNGFNSSAIGRYQIVRKTLRGLRAKLGLKGTDLYDEAMQDRLGAELARQRGANGSLGSEWASLRGQKLGTAIDLARQIPSGASTIPGQRPANADSTATAVAGDAGPAGKSKIVDVAEKFIGMGEHNAGRATLEGFMGGGSIVGTANAWCARFVNASLKAVGDSGTGSNIANSFLRWGKSVEAEAVKAGDIAVEHRNRGVDGQGGHVGIATGKTRIGRNGQLQVETIEGNSSDQVKKDWTDANKLAIRRSTNPAAQVAATTKEAAESLKDLGTSKIAAEKAKTNFESVTSPEWLKRIGGGIPLGQVFKTGPSGFGRGADGNLTMPDARSAAEFLTKPRWTGLGAGDAGTLGTNLGSKTPLGSTAPISPVRSGEGGGSSTTSVSAPITVNGAGQSPDQIANAVQRKLQESMNRRTHDLDPSSVSGIG